MYKKMLYPALLLALFQIVSYFIVEDYLIEPTYNTVFTVLFYYCVFILCLVFWPNFSTDNAADKVYESDSFHSVRVGYFHFFIIIVTFYFINLPTLRLTQAAMELGYDNVRELTFRSPEFANKVFGNQVLQALIHNYVKNALWVAVFFLDVRNKKQKYLFYFVGLSLVLFNASYAGRFYLYYFLIALYVQSIRFQTVRVRFDLVRKFRIALAVFSVYIVAAMILSSRTSLSHDHSMLQSLAVYHYVQPFLLSQKIETAGLFVNGFPFRTFIESAFFPIYYLLGYSYGELTIGVYLSNFHEPSLYSISRGSYINSFVTMFAYFYADFGLLGPLFLFFYMLYVQLALRLMMCRKVRDSYMACFSLFMFFSLFQGIAFNPFVSFFIVFFPWINYFYSKRRWA